MLSVKTTYLKSLTLIIKFLLDDIMLEFRENVLNVMYCNSTIISTPLAEIATGHFTNLEIFLFFLLPSSYNVKIRIELTYLVFMTLDS